MGKIKYGRKKVVLKEQLALHAMMLPGVILATVFSILPMIGLVMAFQKYSPSQGFFGSQFVDFWQFKKLFSRPDFWQVTFNTVWIALLKIIFVSVLSIVVALLLNEVRTPALKKSVQTIIFLPYFLSWALLGEIMVDMFSVSGMFNKFLGLFGANTGHYWIVDPDAFRTIIVSTDVWKTLGYQVVIFLAAITNIDPTLYEAAEIDGAGHMQRCWHVTIPGLMTMIVLQCILNIGNIMNAGFEQILVMYNPSVYETGDILDTLSYRTGLLAGNDFSLATAIGLFKSVISCVFFAISYWLAYKVKGYKIF